MKKLLSILGVVGIISASTTGLIACNIGKKPQNVRKLSPQSEKQKHDDINSKEIKDTVNLLNDKVKTLNQRISARNMKINDEENKALQNNISQLKQGIQKLDKEFKRTNIENIRLNNLLNDKIKVNNIEKVKEYEIRQFLKTKILAEVQEINSSLTDKDFVFNFNDYFNYLQPREINLSRNVNKYVINIEGQNNGKGKINNLEISLPRAISKITDFTNFSKIEIPPLENKLPNYPDGYFSTSLLENKIREQFLKQIQKINDDLNENDFTITFNSEPYKSKMDDLKNVYICTRKNLDKCNSEDTEFDITIIGKNNAKGKFTITVNLTDFCRIK